MIRENGEFVIESYDGVSSWLVWIHFLVMFLLMIILVYLTIVSVLSDKSTSSSSSHPSSSSFNAGRISIIQKYNRSISNTHRSSQEDIKVNEDNRANQSTSRRTCITRDDNRVAQVNGVEAFSPPPTTTTTTTTATAYCSAYNPCYLLELGRRVFLKCLGLDDSSPTSRDSFLPHGNNDEAKLTKRDKRQL